MSDTITKLADGACPISPTNVYTATSKTSVLAIDISNPTVSDQNVTLKINARILFAVTMKSMGGVSWHGPQVLETGQIINIVCDSASCEYNITGVVIT